MPLWLVEPEGTPIEAMGLGWMSRHASGKGSIPSLVELKGLGPPILLNGIWAIWISY